MSRFRDIKSLVDQGIHIYLDDSKYLVKLVEKAIHSSISSSEALTHQVSFNEELESLEEDLES